MQRVGDTMNQHIDEQTIDTIRSSVDIVDVVSEYVQLTKRGRNYFGLCPFHGEQTPSFSVAQEKQIFHCFGCGAGGNVMTFLMDIEGLSFQQTVAKLAARAGIEVDIKSDQHAPVATNSSHQAWKKAHSFAASYYHHLLLNTVEGEEALAYLKNRGITEDIIKKFQLGWSLPRWDGLTNVLKQREFDLDEMEKCGLIIRKDQGESFFDRFRGRIMFPIWDDKGQVIAFSGRILHASDEDAKYMNSPETDMFKKNEVLYNLHQARVAIRMKKQVVVAEGFMDIIAFHRAGVEHAVGTMGTALTQQHVTHLKRLTSEFLFCFDGDKAGMEAARKALEATQNDRQLKRSVIVLPDQADPDDYLNSKGPEALHQFVEEKGLSEMSFYMLYHRKGLNLKQDSDVLHYTNQLLELIAKRASPIEQSLYVKQLAEDTHLDLAVLQQQLRKLLASRAKKDNLEKPPVPQVEPATRKLNATERAEYVLLAHLIEDPDQIGRMATSENMDLFVHEDFTEAYLHLAAFYEKYPAGDFQRLIETTEQQHLKKLFMQATMMDRDPESNKQEIEDCMRQLRKYRVEKRIEEIMHEAKLAEKMSDYAKALELAKEAIELKRSIHSV